MGVAKQDINDFNARVKRINNPRNKSYYDPDLGMHVPKRVTRDKIKKQNEEPSLLGKIIVSMIIGALGLMAAQILRIRYFDVAASDSIVFYLELIVGAWAVITLSALMNRRTVGARLAQVAGLVIMITAGHNIIWRWPDQMAVIYTQAYVDEVLETTSQHSVVYRGQVYGLPSPQS
ncbi:hypothetical protein [Loktanella sp. Alg231-35]|uniref:hypothetical protein n=1 Tax=Loktanella sp. Alg231-35 TaxID=1922220 RepID=UPI00131F2128|nr:hypothetical protein [Loktanella sp. Alg231-35]